MHVFHSGVLNFQTLEQQTWELFQEFRIVKLLSNTREPFVEKFSCGQPDSVEQCGQPERRRQDSSLQTEGAAGYS